MATGAGKKLILLHYNCYLMSIFYYYRSADGIAQALRMFQEMGLSGVQKQSK